MAKDRRNGTVFVIVVGFCFVVGLNGQPLIQTGDADDNLLDLFAKFPGIADLYEDVRQQSIMLSKAELKVSLISKNLIESYEKDVAEVKKLFTESSPNIEMISQNLTKFGTFVNETESSLEEFSKKLNGFSKNLSDLISRAESQQTADAALDSQIQSLMHQTSTAENVSQIILSNVGKFNCKFTLKFYIFPFLLHKMHLF